MTARPGFIPDPDRPLSLGPRTLEHLRHAAAGRSVKETAALMWVSQESVKSARKRIFERLEARNTCHAIAIAYEKGLLP